MLNKINPSIRSAVDPSRQEDGSIAAPPPFSSRRPQGLDQMGRLRSATRLLSPTARAEEKVRIAQEKENREIASNVYSSLARAADNTPGTVMIPYTDTAGNAQVAELDSFGPLLRVSVGGKAIFSMAPKEHLHMEEGHDASDPRISSILQNALHMSLNATGVPGGGFNRPMVPAPVVGGVPAAAAMMLGVDPNE
ncbi:MAG TPA: hypothetical protein VMR43_05955, partial [Variovorax sp.]|nr:hypothetical protein [Variovorax sp.]